MENDFVEKVERLIQERVKAKQEGDHQEAYRIERETRDMGVLIYDSPEGTHWRML